MMMSMIGSILSMMGPIIVWGIKTFIQNAEKKQRAVANFYEFVASIDKQSAGKVANYLAAEDSLKEVQDMIREKQLVEPDRKPASAAMIQSKYEIPEIVDVDVDLKTHGKYISKHNQAKGLVVHYTAGHSAKGRANAIGTLRSLASRGLGCLTMDTDGIIYKAKSQDLDEIAWHAGKSSWKGKSGISRYCMGMEICNAGKLSQDGKSWFGLQIPKDQQRHIATTKSNQVAGTYHKYTEAQEKALINFCLWQLDVNPDFELDWIVGHDEVAKGRKFDPGGSLSMSMPEFREHLKTLMQ